MSRTMKAIEVKQLGAPEVMQYVNVDRPQPQAQQLLIQVHAAAVNRCDLLQREGPYQCPPSNSPRLGIEISGVVVECGTNVTHHSVGDRVFGYVNGGGYAQYCIADEHLMNPLPPHWTFTQGAAVAEAFQVAYEVLFTTGQLQPKQTLLHFAGASSLGIAAIQLAKHAGCQVITTVSTEKKHAHCLELGADQVIRYKEESVMDAVMAFTQQQGVNLIIDPIGPSALDQHIHCLKHDGTIVSIGTLGGDSGTLNILPFMAKRATLSSYNTRGRTLDYQRNIVKRFQQHCLPLLAQDRFTMPIDRCFTLAEAALAHHYVFSNQNLGKVILTVEHN